MTKPQADMDLRFMSEAIAQAELASRAGEVPVGAVIVSGGQIIAMAHNLKETLQDPTAHAEVLAIRSASKALGSWRLQGCCIYVTLEPCTMCAGAIVQARLGRLVYGAHDPKSGAAGTLWDVPRDLRNNHWVNVHGGVMEAECASLIQRFFVERRL